MYSMSSKNGDIRNISYKSTAGMFASSWMLKNISNEVNISLSNGVVPSGNKSLLEPMLTLFYVAIWLH